MEVEFVRDDEVYDVVTLRDFYDGTAKGTRNVFNTIKVRFLEIEGGGSGARI